MNAFISFQSVLVFKTLLLKFNDILFVSLLKKIVRLLYYMRIILISQAHFGIKIFTSVFQIFFNQNFTFKLPMMFCLNIVLKDD